MVSEMLITEQSGSRGASKSRRDFGQLLVASFKDIEERKRETNLHFLSHPRNCRFVEGEDESRENCLHPRRLSPTLFASPRVRAFHTSSQPFVEP